MKFANPQQQQQHHDNDVASLAGSVDMDKNNSDVDYYDAKGWLQIQKIKFVNFFQVLLPLLLRLFEFVIS